MKIDIVKNTSRNIIFSIAKKLYGTVLSFFMRTIMIYMLGIEYAGLNGLFTSLLNILSLAELGAGSAIVYSMYRPIAEDDHEKICAMLSLYKKCYRIIGLVILCIGLICMPFLSKMINGEVPDTLNIHALFLMHLLITVCSYWMFAYKSSLFSAFQRTDISSRINMLASTLEAVGQTAALIFTGSYYLYLGISLVAVFIKNCIICRTSARMYPQYKARGILPAEEQKAIIGHVKALFLSKVGGVIVNSADTLVISAVLGISILGMYQNYFYILSAVSGIIIVLYHSCIAGIGNRLVLESADSVYESFENLSFWLIWICGLCCACFLGLFQPFIRIWVGERMLLEYGIVVIFCIYFYIFQMMGLASAFEDAGGIWHYDRFRPLLEGLLNLFLNLVMVRYTGLYGILLSTIVSMAAFSFPWLLRNLFRHLFRRSMKTYLLHTVQYLFWAFMTNVGVGLLCWRMPENSIGSFCIRLAVCLILPGSILILRYGKTEKFKWLIRILIRIKK